MPPPNWEIEELSLRFGGVFMPFFLLFFRRCILGSASIFAVRSETAIVLCPAMTSRYPLLFVGKGLPFDREDEAERLTSTGHFEKGSFSVCTTSASLPLQRKPILVSCGLGSIGSRAEGGLYLVHLQHPAHDKVRALYYLFKAGQDPGIRSTVVQFAMKI